MSLREKIEQKALNMLNRVDDERGLTIIEKGNVKRFLSYYVDDVVGLLDTAIERIRKLRLKIPIDSEEKAWNSAVKTVLAVLGVEGETKK